MSNLHLIDGLKTALDILRVQKTALGNIKVQTDWSDKMCASR